MSSRIIIITICLFCCGSVYSQNISYTKEKIDSIVNGTDSALSISQKDFTLNKTTKGGKVYTEKWTYLRDIKYLLYFRIEFRIDSTEYTEVYYLDKGNLVHAWESEVSYYPSIADAIPWSWKYYFSNRKLIYEISFGHGKSEIGGWDPEKEVPLRFLKRKSERPELSK